MSTLSGPTSRASVVMLVLSASVLLAACGRNPAPQAVSFTNDIRPIFEQHCLECHDTGGAGAVASGLKLTTYQDAMKGTKFGPIIKAGDSASSTLVILVEGRADPSINMPHGGRPPLSKTQTQKLRQWIDEGALNN